jgi:hypothetical protein
MDVLVVLMVDVGHEGVALRLLPCDLLVEGSLGVRLVGLWISQGDGAAWAVVPLVEGL